MLGRLTSRRAAWLTVIAVSSSLFIALALCRRLPAADLPAHAVMLRHMIDLGAPGYDGPYELLPSAGYTALFAIARLLALLTAPMRAITIATSFAVALLPVAAAAVATSLRRSPALGLFALIGAFSSVLGWGMASLILGASALGFVVAAAVSCARKPTMTRGAVLFGAVLLVYTAHFAAWVVAVPAAVFLVVTRTSPSLRARALLPVLFAAIPTIAAFFVWTSHPATRFHALRMEDGIRWGPSPLARVLELPMHLAGFGRGTALLPAWATLVVLAVALVVGAVVVRGRRRTTWTRTLARAAPALVAGGCVVAYLTAPFDYPGAFFVYPRFLVFAAALVPALLPRAGRGRAWPAWVTRTERGGALPALVERGDRRAALSALVARTVPLIAVVPALALVACAYREARAWGESTACLDEIVDGARSGESLVVLNWTLQPATWNQPVAWHIGDVVVADKGGALPFDFVDIGVNAVRYRDGFTRDIPHWDDAHPDQYNHAAYGAEFTAWLLVNAPKDIGAIFGPQTGWTVAQCGSFTLVTDAAVPAGSRPATRFLPHRE